MPDGAERVLRTVDCAQANPDGMSASDNCYLIHISKSTILDNMRLRFETRRSTSTRIQRRWTAKKAHTTKGGPRTVA